MKLRKEDGSPVVCPFISSGDSAPVECTQFCAFLLEKRYKDGACYQCGVVPSGPHSGSVVMYVEEE